MIASNRQRDGEGPALTGILAPCDFPESETDMTDAVIVVSTPRSGSSWLSRILRAHPELHVYTHNTNSTQILYLLYPTKTFNPFGDDDIENTDGSVSFLKKLRVRMVKAYYRNSDPNRRLVLASPTNVEFLPLLMQVFPNARYVHLKRNHLDVIASFRKFLEYNGQNGFWDRYRKLRHRGHLQAGRTALAHLFHSLRWISLKTPGYVGTRPSGFQKATSLPLLEFLSWYDVRLEEQIERALESVPDDRRHTVTYEGLVLNYEMELRRLLQFMGVNIVREHLQKTSINIRPGGVGRYKKLFNKDELEVVSRYLLSKGVNCLQANATGSNNS